MSNLHVISMGLWINWEFGLSTFGLNGVHAVGQTLGMTQFRGKVRQVTSVSWRFLWEIFFKCPPNWKSFLSYAFISNPVSGLSDGHCFVISTERCFATARTGGFCCNWQFCPQDSPRKQQKVLSSQFSVKIARDISSPKQAPRDYFLWSLWIFLENWCLLWRHRNQVPEWEKRDWKRKKWKSMDCFYTSSSAGNNATDKVPANDLHMWTICTGICLLSRWGRQQHWRQHCYILFQGPEYNTCTTQVVVSGSGICPMRGMCKVPVRSCEEHPEIRNAFFLSCAPVLVLKRWILRWWSWKVSASTKVSPPSTSLEGHGMLL